MGKIIVVGGGAAGMLAAYSAASYGAEVLLLEKMNGVGKKIRITGKGRCNITNNADIKGCIANIPGNGAFLHSAFYQFFNEDIIRLLEEFGVETKVERGGRVFPVSDQAIDVVNALQRMVIAMGGRIQTDTKVKSLVVEDGAVKGVRLDSGDILDADAVIVTTGGASYPGTGSSGDGYRMAKDVGHMIVPLTPSLVPLEIEEDWIQDLQGLSLRNVSVVAYADDTKIDSDFGEMLFTHFGVSGPIVLSMSRKIALCLEEKQDVVLSLDLKPALSEEQLDRRVQRDFEKYLRKQVKNALNDLLPQKLIPVVIDLAYLDEEKPIHQVTKEERLRLVHTIKHIEMTVTKTRPMAEAIVTAGGVSTKEVNPKTMASRIVNGLYFAGEVLDIDGYTGGFNLQAAFSTGYSAGKAAAESLL